MSTEELKKELEKLKDFKVYVFEGDVYVKAEDYREKAIENKNLKLTIEQMENTCKDYLNDRDTLREENRKLQLHIEAKDKAYTALLKDYEELKEDNKRLRAEIEEWLKAIRQKI